MFLLLSRVLLWLLIGTVIYSLFQRVYPTSTFVGRLAVAILLIVLALAFINPNDAAVASLWRLISFPLKPLGAAILLLIFAAQRLKDGGIGKPGGFLVGWALGILLLASTPAVAYFLVRTPIAQVGTPTVASQQIIQNQQQSLSASSDNSNSGVLIASGVSDIPLTPYLAQTPNDIPRRGLRLDDFVPNAETLSLTTQVWERYLNSIYVFLRGGR